MIMMIMMIAGDYDSDSRPRPSNMGSLENPPAFNGALVVAGKSIYKFWDFNHCYL